MCAVFVGMLYVIVDVSLQAGTFLLLYLFGPLPLLGVLVCGFYLSPWGRRRLLRKAGRRLAGTLVSSTASAAHLPAWTLRSEAFPQSRRYLSSAGLSPFEVECALVLAAELDPEDRVELSVFVERVRALS